jgi:ligand-binding sensor domain-containing protein
MDPFDAVQPGRPGYFWFDETAYGGGAQVVRRVVRDGSGGLWVADDDGRGVAMTAAMAATCLGPVKLPEAS